MRERSAKVLDKAVAKVEKRRPPERILSSLHHREEVPKRTMPVLIVCGRKASTRPVTAGQSESPMTAEYQETTCAFGLPMRLLRREIRLFED